MARHQDQSHRHPGLPRLLRRGGDRPPRGRRGRGGGERHRRRRGGHREGLGGLRPPAPAAHALRVHDGQGARRLRAGVPGHQGSPDPQGRAGRGPHRRRSGVPRDHQSLLRPLPQLQEGNRQERIRRGSHPRGVPAALPGVHRAAHRGRGLDRRRADRALPGRRGDSAGAVHRRGEARHAGRADRPPLLRERHSHLRPADAAQEDGRAAALAGGGQAAGRGAAGRPGVQDPLRSPRGRRHPVPALHRRAQERRGGVERGARGGGEAEPPLHPAGQGADRGGAAQRG